MDPPKPSMSSRNAVDLVIRFASSDPDLILTIPRPEATSTLSLKQLIRPHLSPSLSSNRLRLIAAGKVLSDQQALSGSINIPPRPPSDKGKAPLSNPRVYIHCSIGDALTEAELAEEVSSAAESNLALSSVTARSAAPTPAHDARAPTSTTAQPRGFDRLLTSGFSATEVAELRASFLALQSHAYTPDNMPSGAALRALEDAWLDASPSQAGGGEVEATDEAGLEDMLWGNLMGFFWPVAAVIWLLREEGVWSRRRQVAVLSGMLVNLTFGFLRLTN